MKQILIVFLLLFSIAAKSQTSEIYIVPDTTALKAYYGVNKFVQVTATNQLFTLCTTCTLSSPTILSGAGGRKWSKVSDTAIINSLSTKASISGQVFTGVISASNLSGTNTGDETTTRINALYGYTPARNDSVIAHNLRLLTITDSIIAHNLRILKNVDSINVHNQRIIANTAAIALKQNLVTLTTTGSSGASTFNQSTGALNIPSYAGGSDSAIWKNNATYVSNNTLTMAGKTQSFLGGKTIFDSIQVGATPNTIGTLLNESFTGTSIPASFTKGSFLGATYSNKALITGGLYWYPPSNTANTTPWGSALQFNTKHMPYEKLDIYITFVPQTKVAGNIMAITKGSTGNGGIVGSNRETIALDLSNSFTSGRVKLGTDSITSFIAATDSTARASWSVGDSMVWWIHKDGWSVVSSLVNKTTGTVTKTQFSQTWNGSGGLFNFVFLSSSSASAMVHVLNIKVSSFNKKGVVYCVGTSQTSGAGVTQEVRRWSNQVFGSNGKYFETVGLPSSIGRVLVSQGVIDEILADATPSKVIYELGYNDETDPTTAPIYSVTLDSLITKTVRAGITPYITGIPPKSSIAHIYDDTAVAISARKGIAFIDVRTPLLNGGTTAYSGYLSLDGIHVNNTGQLLWAAQVVAKVGNEVLADAAKDTIPLAKINGIPSAQTSEVNRLLGIKGNNELVQLPFPQGIDNLVTTIPNVGIGVNAGRAITTGVNNVEINPGNGFLTTGSNNVIIGGGGGPNGQSTASNAVLIGSSLSNGWGNFANRIAIGQFYLNDYAVANEAVFAPGLNLSQTFYFGGKSRSTTGANMLFKVPATTFQGGSNVIWETGSAASSAYAPGVFKIRTNTTTAFSTYTDRFTIDQDKVSVNGGLAMSGTAQGFIPTNVTSAQKAAMNQLQSVTVTAGGTGATDFASMVFAGTYTIVPIGYVRVTAGVITSTVVTYPGSGITSISSVTVAGTSGVTLTPVIAPALSSTIYCTDCTATDGSTGTMQTYQTTTSSWKNLGGSVAGQTISSWQSITATTKTMVAGEAYGATSTGGTQLVFTLPSSPVLGQIFQVEGVGNSGGWRIAQNASQVIKQSGNTSTAGTGGYVQSTTAYDVITLRYEATNTFVVIAGQGTFTFN